MPPLRLTAALLLAITAAASVASFAHACPMCKDSVPASDAQSAGGLPGGFNSSIYLMLGALFCVIGMVAWTLIKAGRGAGAGSAERRAATPQAPGSKSQ